MQESEYASLGIYHDIYDFAILPVSLGDIFNWVIKTSLRCRKANRKRVHIHIIGDAKVSGSSVLMKNSVSDLFIMELLPAFYSCPDLDGLTLHSSRAIFENHWRRLAQTDSLAGEVFEEHQNLYKNRSTVKLVLDFLTFRCSDVSDLNQAYREWGYLPRLRVMEECAAEVQQMKAEYPDNTYWVTLHSRLSRLDGGLRSGVPENYFNRDASFLQWYRFIELSRKAFPNVRFVLIGRLQEKPLALLKLANVIAPRALGMNIGHEIAFISRSHFFMGSIAGPAQIAIYSSVDYALFNCLAAACKNFVIPYGTPHLPFATPNQTLHYGREDAELLLNVLEQQVSASGLKGPSNPSSTHEFYL